VTEFVRGIEKYPGSQTGVVATLGTFDGIHLGHQAILKRVNEESERLGVPSVLITFHPHPRVVLSPSSIPLLLTTLEEKEVFIPDFFKGTVLILEFNEQLKNLTADEFVQQILVDRLGVKKLIVGHDHALGKDRTGNIDRLRELGQMHEFEVEVVGPVLFKDTPVSSSRIRTAMYNRKFSAALDLLGHDYAIYGIVERGLGLGRRLGYPTANVAYNHRKLLPPEGVYSCWCEVDGVSHPGMMFIGQNYFNPQARITVEANIFDFDRDIYDQGIVVYPNHFIRSNQRFESTEDLVAQLERDKKQISQILKEESDDVAGQRKKSSGDRSESAA